MTERLLRKSAPGVLAFVWPAIYLVPFLFPDGLQSRNDFWILYWKYKVYLLDALVSEHRIPGWSPSEGCGYPFLANPFAAALYPLNLPLAIFFRLAGGYSLFDHQVFTVLGLCIFSAGLYFWLRESGAPVRAALVATLVMGTSLKMTELQRFPNAMHAAAWFPWILLGIAWCRRSSSRVRGVAMTAAATALLATAGYPYFFYYAQFLVIPYAAAIVWSRTRSLLVDSETDPAAPRESAAAALAIAGGFAAAVLACAPYLAAMRRMLSLTTDRAKPDLRFATLHSSGAIDTVGSLVFPPAASAEGWFYFGQLPLLFLILFVAGAFEPVRKWSRDRSLAVGVCSFVLVVSSVTWGARSPAFRLLWEVWPGFRPLRVWPRLHVILVPPLALLLARAWVAFERLANSNYPRRGDRRRIWWTSAAAILAVLLIHAAFLRSGFTHRYWQRLIGPSGTLRAWAFPETGFVVFFIVAGLLLLAGLGYAARSRPRWNLMAFVFVVAAACDTGSIGLSQWASRRVPSDRVRARPDVAAAPERSLTVPRQLAYDTIQLDARYNTGVIPNWYLQNYVTFLRTSAGFAPGERFDLSRVPSVPGVAALLGLGDGRRLFFVPRLDFPSASAFVEEAKRYEETAAATVAVVEYTGDRMVVDITTSLPGFLCFVDNTAPGWTATVDGRTAPIEPLFGTFKAIRIGAGRSRASWDYDPW